MKKILIVIVLMIMSAINLNAQVSINKIGRTVIGTTQYVRLGTGLNNSISIYARFKIIDRPGYDSELRLEIKYYASPKAIKAGFTSPAKVKGFAFFYNDRSNRNYFLEDKNPGSSNVNNNSVVNSCNIIGGFVMNLGDVIFPKAIILYSWNSKTKGLEPDPSLILDFNNKGKYLLIKQAKYLEAYMRATNY